MPDFAPPLSFVVFIDGRPHGEPVPNGGGGSDLMRWQAAVMEVFRAVAWGKVVKLIALDAAIFPGEAAEILNVSPGFVRKLMVVGRLVPARLPGRVWLADVLAYKQEIDAKRSEILDDLAALTQDEEREEQETP